MAVQSMKWLVKNWYALTADQLNKLKNYDALKARVDSNYMSRNVTPTRTAIDCYSNIMFGGNPLIPQGKIQGVWNYQNELYVYTTGVDVVGGPVQSTAWFKVSDILQNGGGIE